MSLFRLVVVAALLFAAYTGYRVLFVGAAAAPSRTLPEWASEENARAPRPIDRILTLKSVDYVGSNGPLIEDEDGNNLWHDGFEVAASVAPDDATLKTMARSFVCTDRRRRQVLESGAEIEINIAVVNDRKPDFSGRPMLQPQAGLSPYRMPVMLRVTKQLCVIHHG